jgi:type IX secretion system substrate protein
MVIPMKKIILFVVLGALLLMPFLHSTPSVETGYQVIAWNDLGMHCSNKDFSTLVVLPPYNNLRAQVIKIGSDESNPEIITEGIRVTYEVPGNTYSVGKTNFWDYSEKLFGVALEDNIGLTGKGMSGEMDAEENYFKADGIPITPFADDDLENEAPYQLALVKVFDLEGNLLAVSRPVIPVSNEIGCVQSGCHSSAQSILNHHEDEDGFDPNDTPILCASCHASNALGTTGDEEAKSLSYRIHKEHAGKTDDCYKCHPGQHTQCQRGAMASAGKTCQDCHGSLSEVANSIKNGRRPWLDEPSCNQSGCHDSKYAPNSNKLFKDSRSHEGMFCSACHGSAHAIYPSSEANDNLQMNELQGYDGPLAECRVCHGITPDHTGPHGMQPVSVDDKTNRTEITIYPNPAKNVIKIKNAGTGSNVLILDLKGKVIELANARTEYSDIILYDVSKLQSGIYFIHVSGRTLKFIKE